jgi:hypothetical protein
LGHRIRARRTELGKSQERLGRDSSPHWSYVGQAERGTAEARSRSRAVGDGVKPVNDVGRCIYADDLSSYRASKLVDVRAPIMQWRE